LKYPAVSLVICTRNRAARLTTCLQYVSRIETSHTWELVLVDNGSTDGTAAVLAEYAAAAAFPVTVVFEAKPGLGRARNAGWRAARGDLVAFTDDDCYVAPDYLDRMREAFIDKRVGFAGGRVELFDPSDVPMTIKTSVQPESREPRSFIQPGWLPGASMTFRRRVLEAIGGFGDDLGAGTRFCCEDGDAQARASFAGWRGLYIPDAVVAHHHGRKAQAAAALRRIYSTGTGAYMAKFMLLRETRSIYLRNWYWTFRRTLAGGYAYRDLLWEIQGAAAYLTYRLRKRIANGR